MSAWKVPEELIWRLQKGVRTAEARTISTVGGSELELRVYTNTGPKTEFTVSWSQVVRDDRAARKAAADQKAQFIAAGWLAT